AHYKKDLGLQKPEQSIFNLLQNQLSNFKMLDIGIGGGRTTMHFASHVKEYIGVDYAVGMVDSCKKNCAVKFPKAIFEVVDVRNLDKYKENEFDFILFSFNGIDYITTDERFLALKEINRVLKPNGYFCFSSHNIQSLIEPVKFHLRLNLFASIKEQIIWQKVKKINKKQFAELQTSDVICINDGAHDFGLQTHYFRPISQQQILSKTGFKKIRFFSLDSGLEIESKNVSTAAD